MDDEDDPAAVAAAAPEPVASDDQGDSPRASLGARTEPAVHAVGTGPGPGHHRSERVAGLLADADVVVGFGTVLASVEGDTDADLLPCGYDDQASTLAAFADRVAAGDRGVAAFAGDPNVSGYQFLGRVERAVAGRVRVVPGVSSIQLAASRARVPIEHATVACLHRRGDVSGDLDRLARDVGRRHLLVLPRPYDLMPGDVAAHLLGAGAREDRRAIVSERLAHADETHTDTTLAALARHAGDAADSAFSDLSVLSVRRER